MFDAPYEHPDPKSGTHPRYYYDRLLKACEEFRHLEEGEANIHFLLVSEPVVKQGKQILGAVHIPKVQGQLKGVFRWLLADAFGGVPDFLVLLDATFWKYGNDRDREILMYHEMCHMVHAEDREGEPRYDEDGNPVWGLVGHDIEDFNAVVRRYGIYSEDLRRFVDAAMVGEQGRGE